MCFFAIADLTFYPETRFNIGVITGGSEMALHSTRYLGTKRSRGILEQVPASGLGAMGSLEDEGAWRVEYIYNRREG